VIHDRAVIRLKSDAEVWILAFLLMSASITGARWRDKLEIGSDGGLEAVQWAGSPKAGTFHDMEVAHGGGNVRMAEKVLDDADVVAGFEQLCGKRRAKSVRRDALCEGGLPCCIAVSSVTQSAPPMVTFRWVKVHHFRSVKRLRPARIDSGG
jgi:hypothetical protein